MPPRQQKKRNKAESAEEAAVRAAEQADIADGTPTEPEEEGPASPKGGSKRQRGHEAGQSLEPAGAGRHRAGSARRKAGGAAAAAAGDDAALGMEVEMEGLARRASGAIKHRGGGTVQLGHMVSSPLGPEGDSRAYEAVVKVFVIHCEPNFSLPWQRKRQYSSGSSGFIIEGRRILTNAHCVESHTQVKVKRRGSDTKFVASVLAVATEGDMALLTVEDDAFWEGSEPVQFGELPQLQDPVTVVGYPIGGDTMSVTSGVVSRIEVTSYVHGAAELLGIQIDAAINSGNSGGPAFNLQGECVGIAFQSLKHEDAENIGYIIPTPVVMHFINDYEKHGKYTGFPCLGVEWQKLENPDLRSALNMRPEQKGVMVRRVEPTAAASRVLSEGDVLLSFDGMPIANDGTVPFRSGERISFSYLISQKYVDEEAALVLLKKGKQQEVKIKLSAPVKLVPYHTKGQPPSYFIIAGLVFTQVTVPYLRSEYGKEYDFDAPVRLLEKMMHSMAETPDQQVVVLGQVLAAEVNIGYEDISNTQVLMLNGERLRNLKDLVAKVDGCTAPYLEFDLDYHQKLVLNTEASKKATQEILAMHCISQDRSADLLPADDDSAGPSTRANGKSGDKLDEQARKGSGRSSKQPARLNL